MQRRLVPVIWNGFPPPSPFSSHWHCWQLSLLTGTAGKHYDNTNLRKILMYVDLCTDLVATLI